MELAGGLNLFSPREKIEMRGPLTAAGAHRSPPPSTTERGRASRSAASSNQALREAASAYSSSSSPYSCIALPHVIAYFSSAGIPSNISAITFRLYGQSLPWCG